MASVTVPTASAATNASPAATVSKTKRNYARIAELTWIWTIVGYSVLRFVIAWGAFAEHGANVWIFGIIDVGTAWPYAKAVALVCKRAANAEWKQLPLPLIVALTTFFAPYAYLWFAAGEMPAGVRIGMAICVSVLLLAATAGVLAKTRKLRRSANEELIDVRTSTVQDADDAGAVVLAAVDLSNDGDVINLQANEPNTELLIDLTGDQVTLGRSTLL